MIDGTLGEIRLFAGSRTPLGWLPCDGRLVDKSINQALYEVIGSVYGDSGNSFNLPDLRGRAPVGAGAGSGLTAHNLGAQYGRESLTLSPAQLPPHSHSLGNITAQLIIPTYDPGGSGVPESGAGDFGLASSLSGPSIYSDTSNKTGNLPAVPVTISAAASTGSVGTGSAVPLSVPSLAIGYYICYQGNFPSYE